MKKIDALLQKIEVFEKLAVYGDRTSFLKSLAQVAAFPPEGLSQSLAVIGSRLNALADAWEKADAASRADAQNLRDYGRAFERAAFPAYFSSREQLEEKIGDLRRFRDNTLPSLRKVPPSLSGQVIPIQEELGRIESFVNGFMRNTMGFSYPGESAAAPKTETTDVAKPAATTTTPAPQLLQTVKQQIAYMNRLADGLKAQTGAAKARNYKIINSLVAALQNALKGDTGKWGDIKNYIVGRKLITDSLQSLYNDKLEYDDLTNVPALDFGRGVPTAEY